MNTNPIPFAPRTIAQARSVRARAVGTAVRAFIRRLQEARQRFALERKYRRELAELAHSSDRMLADIGLTRSEVLAAFDESRRWIGGMSVIAAAAARRNEAAERSLARAPALPLAADAPSIVPAEQDSIRASALR